jgi:hypothetical protein
MPCYDIIPSQRPHAWKGGGLCKQAPMLTSPLSNQEPFTRRAKHPTAGWHLSLALWKSAVKQVDWGRTASAVDMCRS